MLCIALHCIAAAGSTKIHSVFKPLRFFLTNSIIIIINHILVLFTMSLHYNGDFFLYNSNVEFQIKMLFIGQLIPNLNRFKEITIILHSLLFFLLRSFNSSVPSILTFFWQHTIKLV